MQPHSIIAVLDFGSQYAHLIAKRIRHLGYYTQIFSPAVSTHHLTQAKGIILSGGPSSVFASDVPQFNDAILALPLPILGLCYGHQLIAQKFGGVIENQGHGEFGKAFIELVGSSDLSTNLSHSSQVWMSHEDNVTQCPDQFSVIAKTANCPIAGMQHQEKPIFTLQFHPEVKDSVEGNGFLENFVKQCDLTPNWSMETFIAETKESLQREVGERSVLMFLSGGVDSSVAFALLNDALGRERVLGLLIDNAFLRKNEISQIMECYRKLEYDNVQLFDASSQFLKAIEEKVDPQEKRHLVGETFLQVRDEYLQQLNLNPEKWMLGQGTLYPDIIESGGTEHSNVIKSHHNRVEGVQDLIRAGQVVEPLKELYKDEVRIVGKLLDLPDSVVWRHPFPGPGLSINVLCDHGDFFIQNKEHIDKKAKDVLKESSYQVELLAVRSVGVQGDQRTYTSPAVIIGEQDWEALEQTSIQITNQIREINRVVTLVSPETLPALRVGKAYCTQERLDVLREAEALATKTLEEHQLMREIFQLLVIILPLSIDGTKNCIVLRPVCSEDVMTAQFAKIDWKIINHLAKQIQQIPEVDAVFYDVTHKPPATFGWE